MSVETPDKEKNTAQPDPALLQIKGVGPAMATKLARLGIRTPIDLLFHLPARYEDRSRVTSIAALRPGEASSIDCEVVSTHIAYGRRRSLICKVRDDSGVATLRFFHFSAAQKNSLRDGARLRCFGEATAGRSGLEMFHPEYQLESAQTATAQDNPYLTAIYPSTEGMQQGRWRAFIKSAFTALDHDDVPRLLDTEAIESLNESSTSAIELESLYALLYFLHYPPISADIHALNEHRHPQQRQLAFEELVAQRLSHLRLRAQRNQQRAPRLEPGTEQVTEFASRLPFALTAAQQRVLAEIVDDMQTENAMLRLVQGDVGSGKTVVAAIAALHAITNGCQVAVMAPTEILAEQHANAFSSWLEPLGIRSQLLVSKMSAADKRSALGSVADGTAQLVVGTHALIESSVEFKSLALVIVDEQHRFGVEQRLRLQQKLPGEMVPHQLIMTATPIPRTLAMTFYANLDASVIDELPPGRTPVETIAIANERREDIIDRVMNAALEGRQVYWVCTLVEESEALQAQAAESTANELAELLEGVRVGLIHGRLSSAQKQQVMHAFKQQQVDLLVATTVIEVGVDVPNASLMIIENPERLGLSQLHQLRGRVGRGSARSHCVLLYQSPLSQNARQRIDIMRSTNDGFELAEQDLKMRGPGELLGKRQSGAMTFKLADLERDADLVQTVVSVSDALQEDTSKQGTVAALIDRWCPLAENYANV